MTGAKGARNNSLLPTPGRVHTWAVGSSKERRDPKRSERSPEHHLPPVDDPIDPLPASNAMTPEGYIEGIGSFAQGLKRMFRRWRHK
jgi:hypothetical protein